MTIESKFICDWCNVSQLRYDAAIHVYDVRIQSKYLHCSSGDVTTWEDVGDIEHQLCSECFVKTQSLRQHIQSTKPG